MITFSIGRVGRWLVWHGVIVIVDRYRSKDVVDALESTRPRLGYSQILRDER
jgi:hypothetical protein